jgi:hypothetical protein
MFKKQIIIRSLISIMLIMVSELHLFPTFAQMKPRESPSPSASEQILGLERLWEEQYETYFGRDLAQVDQNPTQNDLVSQDFSSSAKTTKQR